MGNNSELPAYPRSLAGTLLAAREAVMAPIRPLLRDGGVTDQQWRVLRVLSDAAGALDASTIAERALLHAPSVTRILRQLTERGLLVRATDSADRRRSVIEITPTGQNLVRNTAAQTALMLRAYGETFGEERLNQFIAEAMALARALEGFAPAEAIDAQDDD